MKLATLLLACCLCTSAFASPVADLEAQLTEPQRALLNAALVEQRAVLVAAHEAALASATATLTSRAEIAVAATYAARDAETAAKEALAANVTRQADLVATAKAALSDTGISATERLSLLAAVLADAAKSVGDREREKLEAEAAALEKQLTEKRAAIEAVE